MFCAHCGSAVKAEANFCGTCGSPAAPTESTEAASLYSDSSYHDSTYIEIEDDYEKHKWLFKSTKFLAPIAIILLGIGLGIGGFFLGHSYAGQMYPAPDDSTYVPSNSNDSNDQIDSNEDDTLNGNTNPSTSENEENTSAFPTESVEFPGTPIGSGSGDYEAVEFIQTSLNRIRSHFTSIRAIQNTDGVFEAGTRAAVIDFQYRVGLPPTGIVNDITWRRIVETLNYPPSTPDPPFFPRANAYYVTLVNQHLRSGPSTSHDSIKIVDAGTLIWVTEYISGLGWFRVVAPNEEHGFMSAQFLVLDGIFNH
ncbi:MAG: peptidoglycan-binding protein [Defluviitaleaceae bacterium]|nr:peptidoglycan-binding protein [Defluviitaleaceae bacterium]